jgi:hypothetical protein
MIMPNPTCLFKFPKLGIKSFPHREPEQSSPTILIN